MLSIDTFEEAEQVIRDLTKKHPDAFSATEEEGNESEVGALKYSLRLSFLAGLFLVGHAKALVRETDEIENLKSTIERLEHENSNLISQVSLLREAESRLEADRDEFAEKLSQAQAKLDMDNSVQQANKRLEERIQQLLEEFDAYRAEITKKEEEEAIRAKESKRMEGVGDAGIRMIAQDNSQLLEENAQLRTENEALKLQMHELEEFRRNAEMDVEELNNELDEREEQLLRARKVLLSIRRRTEQAREMSPFEGDDALDGSVHTHAPAAAASAASTPLPDPSLDASRLDQSMDLATLDPDDEELAMQGLGMSDDELLLGSREAQDFFGRVLKVWQRCNETDLKYLNPRNRHLSPIQLLDLGTSLLRGIQRDAADLSVDGSKRGGVWAVVCAMIREVVDLRVLMNEHTSYTIRQTEEKQRVWYDSFKQTSLPPPARR